MEKFKINDYITLKQEEGKTNIYIAGTLFTQGRSLLVGLEILKRKNPFIN